MLRAVFVGALLGSLALNAGLLLYASDLRGKVEQLQEQARLADKTRNADADAIATSNRERQEAAQTAQERRDALHEVEKNAADLSDRDFLCRLRGVCFPNGNQGADAAGKPAGGMPGTDAAKRHDGGE